MEIRKFIIEIHPDGSLTCCEYEDPKDAARAANGRAWLAGYKQALKGIKGSNITAGDPRRRCPYCGCCCDYGSPCCDMDGGNIDHPNGCKNYKSKRPSGPSTGTARPVLMRQGTY